MQEHFEQTNTPEMQSVTQWDELRREVYTDCSSLLRTVNAQERLNFDHMQIHFKNVYDSIRKDAVFAGEEPVSINASMGGNSEQSNGQNADLPERDSSRLNREDDRQPYLDAARHQGIGEISNEQAAESPERFSSRMNREDDRQPYVDRERHQDYEVTAL